MAHAMLLPALSPPLLKGFLTGLCLMGLGIKFLFCELVKESQVISASGRKVWGEHSVGDGGFYSS